MANALTATQVKALRTPGQIPRRAWARAPRSTRERRVWVFRYERNKSERSMSLGNANVVSLAEARDVHTEARALLAQGKNPLEEQRKQQQGPAPTHAFATVAESYITAHEEGWKNPKHRQQWRSRLTTYAKPLANKSVDHIDVNDALAVLQPIWTAKPETASRLRGRIEMCSTMPRRAVGGRARTRQGGAAISNQTDAAGEVEDPHGRASRGA